jgi:LemA protein
MQHHGEKMIDLRMTFCGGASMRGNVCLQRVATALSAVLIMGPLSGCGYNTPGSQDEAVTAAWGEVDDQLERRNDLVPKLVKTIKGYAAPEKEVLLEVSEARSRVVGAGNPAQVMQASKDLSSALSLLLAVMKRYPETESNQDFIRLQDELTRTEHRLSVARIRYNEAVAAAEAQSFFGSHAELYQFVFLKLLPYQRVLQAVLQERDVLASNMKIMDAGTGTGVLIRILYPMAREKGLSDVVFHAFDLTPAMLDVFHRWIRAEGAEDSVSTRVQDVLQLETLPETWDDYDLIVTAAMLEYIPPESLHTAVAGLLARLKPGGKMIWIVSGRTLSMRFLVGWLWRANLYDKAELDAVLAKAGAEHVEYLSFPRPYHATDGHMLAVEITRP